MKPKGEPYAAVYASAAFHRKMIAIPEKKRVAAYGFWCATLALCQAYRNDGLIPVEQLPAVFPCLPEQREILVQLLKDVDLFEEVEGGIQVHDYLDWNRSRAQIEAGVDAMREGGRKGGKASGQTRRGKAGSQPSKPTLQASTEREESAEKEECGVEPSEPDFTPPPDDAPEIRW